MTGSNTTVLHRDGFAENNRSFYRQTQMTGGGYNKKQTYRRNSDDTALERSTSSLDTGGGNRRRLDSSSSSDTSSANSSVGTGGGGVIKKKRRSHRPRGCRGGGSRRRRAQRAAAAAAAAADGGKSNVDSNSRLQQENITPIPNQTIIACDSDILANKQSKSLNESSVSPSIQGDVVLNGESEVTYNSNINTCNNEVGNLSTIVRPSNGGYDNGAKFAHLKALVSNNEYDDNKVDAPIPNLLPASSFASSSSSSSSGSVSSDANGAYYQNHLNHHPHYQSFLPPSVSMGHTVNQQLPHQGKNPPPPYMNNMHGDGASLFNILPSMPQQGAALTRNDYSGPVGLPPLPKRSYVSTSQMAASMSRAGHTDQHTQKNPYSLHQQQTYQDPHQENSYSGGGREHMNSNNYRDNFIDSEESKMDDSSIIHQEMNTSQQNHNQSQEKVTMITTMMMTPAPQRLPPNPKTPFTFSAMGESSLFNTSPRSFLMGGPGTSAGKANKSLYTF